MRNKTNIDFSLILPSRRRPYLLNNCINSFFSKAVDPTKVEAIILCDFDDLAMRHFESLVLSNTWNIKIIFQRQSRNMIQDYNNYGSQCSTGKYVWQINDDVEMDTQNWDKILIENIDKFLTPDKILYVHVNDSTHSSKGTNVDCGCCFPILSKETIDAQNCHMPGEINMWGADAWLFKIFKKLPKNRILNLENEIKLLHHSRHNATKEPDETAFSVAEVFEKGTSDLTPEQFNNYVELLSKNL